MLTGTASLIISRCVLRRVSNISISSPVRSWKIKLYPQCLCVSNHIHTSFNLGRQEPPSFFDPGLRKYLLKARENYGSLLQNKASASYSELGKIKASFENLQLLSDLANKLIQVENELEEIEQLQKIAQDSKTGDKDLQEMVKDENERLQILIGSIQEQVISVILPENENPTDGIIVEFSAGVGGQEAMLFCGELLDLYCSYCESRGFEYTLTQFEKSDLEGVRHASINIDHPDAYCELRFESGVHRVQRIPKTEKAGRIHTSTVTVAIFPRPSEVTVRIDPKDLRIETKRASGAGGQHVNTTESAVRITHLPTGLSVECQTQRSQIQNRQVAMNTLRARLYQMKIDEQQKSTRSSRKLQVGTSARSDKIRTYNFPQDRITDHRINFTSHNLSEFLRGGRPFETLLQNLKEESRRERLLEFLEQNRQ